MVRVLFVCLGNICRSPMAEAMFRKLVEEAGLEADILVDSAGTGDWHVGEIPHQGTREILDRNGISYEGIRSRQVTLDDFDAYDYIVAMDEKNLRDLASLGAPLNDQRIFRLLDLVRDSNNRDVPDPYFDNRFDRTYNLLEAGCQTLLTKITEDLSR